jgi:hypothetical protein
LLIANRGVNGFCHKNLPTPWLDTTGENNTQIIFKKGGKSYEMSTK